jgi:hypothetical protein
MSRTVRRSPTLKRFTTIQVRPHPNLQPISIIKHLHTMKSTSKQLYLADNPPSVVKLEIKSHFEALNAKQKLYAHHISRFVQP